VILSTYNTPSIFVKTRLAIFARSTEYPKFSNKNPSKKNNKSFARKKKVFAKILRLKKKQETLDNKKQKIIIINLNSFNKLNILKELEQKEYKKKQGRNPSYLFLLAGYRPLLTPLRSTR
jgi:hypothetical protein